MFSGTDGFLQLQSGYVKLVKFARVFCSAEFFIVDEIGNHAVGPADDARTILVELDLAERVVESVKDEEAADKRCPFSEEKSNRLIRLDAPHDAWNHAEHSNLLARHY